MSDDDYRSNDNDNDIKVDIESLDISSDINVFKYLVEKHSDLVVYYKDKEYHVHKLIVGSMYIVQTVTCKTINVTDT